MSKDYREIDPDDFFADTRMSFGDHLEDLRVHLWRAVKGFFIACFFAFFIGKDVLRFIAKPVSDQLQNFYDKRLETIKEDLDEQKNSDAMKANRPSEWFQLRIPKRQVEALRKGDYDAVHAVEKPKIDDEDTVILWMSYPEPLRALMTTVKAQSQVGKRFALTTLSVQEAFMVYLKVSLVTGFVLGAPWIFYQIWSFVAVGLYPHEKRLVNVYMPFSIALFVLGVLLCEFFVIPKAVEALLWFNEWIGLEPDLRLSEWLGFAIWMPLVFGLSFQTPLVMLFIYRVGAVSVEALRGGRRLTWFLMAIFAAVITPSTDPYSMLFLWVPLCLLFEVGIWLCLLYPKPPSLWDEDEPESDEVIEV